MLIQRIFIIHGTNGNSRENWFPWLKEELVKANPDIKAIVPDFPTGNNQSLRIGLRHLSLLSNILTVIAYLSVTAWALHS